MRALIVTVMLAAAALGAYADVVVGNGKVETERRNVPAFSSISVGGSGTLRVHRGTRKVEITSDSNILPYVTTTVEGGELKIGFKPFTSIMKSTKQEFDITLPDFTGLRLSGSGDAYIDAFSGDTFSATVSGSGGVKAELDYTTVALNASGSGGFDANVKADKFDLRCTGSGSAFLRGSSSRAAITISGSADVGGRDFAANDARVVISGSGNVDIRTAKSLDASLSGSGRIRYWGNPSISQRVSGSGSISKAGD